MSNNKLKIGQLNVERKNVYELILKCRNDKFDILLLSEFPAKHSIKDYMGKVLLCDGSCNDAAIVIMNQNISLGKLTTNEHSVMVELKDYGFNVSSWYIRPTNNHLKRFIGLQMFKNMITRRRRWTVVGGDLNTHSRQVGLAKIDVSREDIDLANWIGEQGWNIINELDTHTCRNKANGGVSTPDWTLITTDMIGRVEWAVNSDYDFFCDHRLIEINIQVGCHNQNTRTVIKMGKFLSAVMRPNRDTSMDNWYTNFKYAIEQATVIRSEKSNTVMLPPDNKQLKNKITHLNRLIKRQGMHVDPRLIVRLKSLKMEDKNIIREWREARYKTNLESINTDNMYQMITKPIKRKNGKLTHLMIGDEKIVDQMVMIEKLLSYHFPPEPLESFDDIVSNAPYDPPINEWEISLAMTSFKPNKAPGIDGIDIKLLREWRKRDKEYFDSLYLHWWNNRTFPDELKTSNIILLIKNNDKTLTVENTRPIGLLSVIGKVFERIISYRIAKKLLTDKRLHDNQFGFLPGKSITMALQIIHDQRSENYKNNTIEIMAALDIKSAFDKIKYSALLRELNSMNIAANLIELLKSYFTNRKVLLQIDNSQMETQTNRGLVQGSKLSPLCFVIAMDRVLKGVENVNSNGGIKTKILAYADDITIIVSEKDDYNKVRNHLAKLLQVISTELDALGLKLSPEKTTFVTNKINPPGSIRIYNKSISIVDKVKILGVIFNNSHEYTDHLHYIEEKLEHKLKLIKWKLTKGDYCALEVKQRIATTVLVPLVLYASEIWFKDKVAIIKVLKKLYRKIAQVVINAFRTTSYAALSILSGIQPLHLTCLYKQLTNNLKNSLTCLDKTIIYREPAITDRPDPWHTPDIKMVGEIRKSDDVKFNNNELVFYTDGSRDLDALIQKHSVGAAVVLMRGKDVIRIERYRLFHHNNIFEAESIAIFKACQIAYTMKLNQLNLVTDSLSAVKALTGNKWKSNIILNIVKYTLDKRIQLNLWWCKAHVGILGNEIADREAKLARKNGMYNYIPASQSYGNQLIRELIKDRAKVEFCSDTFGRTLKTFISAPDDKVVDHFEITRETVKLYTGHGPYMAYFFELGRATNNSCSCSELKQDSRHLLYECEYFVDTNLETALSLGMKRSQWSKGWQEVVKHKSFHLMIRRRAWKINSTIEKINHMRILPRGVVATHFRPLLTTNSLNVEEQQIHEQENLDI